MKPKRDCIQSIMLGKINKGMKKSTEVFSAVKVWIKTKNKMLKRLSGI